MQMTRIRLAVRFCWYLTHDDNLSDLCGSLDTNSWLARTTADALAASAACQGRAIVAAMA